MVEGCWLDSLLEELYPFVRPLVEDMLKRRHRLMALALGPRFAALGSISALNKKLVQGQDCGLRKT